MSLEIVPFSAVRPEDWDHLVRTSPDGWTFGLTGWRRLILSVPDWQLDDHSFALAEGTRVLAAVPLQFDPRHGELAATGWGGCGPIVASNQTQSRRQSLLAAAFDRMDAVAREVGAARLAFWTLPVTGSSIANTWGVNPFVFYGFDDNSGISQVIDLTQDEKVLWAGLSSTARQTIRGARDRGYEVRRGGWPELVDDYVSLHRETYQRTGITPHPRAYFDGIAREMAHHHALWVARNPTGDPIGFHNDIHFGVAAWYHTGCSTTEALEVGANYLLFWEAIRGAKAAGLSWYDCGEIFPATIDTKSRGLTLFKTRFGGTPHRFIKCSRSYEKNAEASIEPEASAMGANGEDIRVCEPAAKHTGVTGLMASFAGRFLTRMRS